MCRCGWTSRPNDGGKENGTVKGTVGKVRVSFVAIVKRLIWDKCLQGQYRSKFQLERRLFAQLSLWFHIWQERSGESTTDLHRRWIVGSTSCLLWPFGPCLFRSLMRWNIFFLFVCLSCFLRGYVCLYARCVYKKKWKIVFDMMDTQTSFEWICKFIHKLLMILI